METKDITATTIKTSEFERNLEFLIWLKSRFLDKAYEYKNNGDYRNYKVYMGKSTSVQYKITKLKRGKFI